MKKICPLLFFLLPFASWAQSGFFLQPEGGMGMTNAAVKMDDYIAYYKYDIQKPHSYFTYTAGLGVGYMEDKWVVNSGIYYIRSGYISRFDEGDFVLEHVTQKNILYSIAVPVTVGYRLAMCRQFFLIPSIGAMASYNFSAWTHTTTNFGSGDSRLNGSSFDKAYNSVSVWGVAQVLGGYSVTPRLSVIAGPQFQYMLTSVLKDAYNKQHDYVCTFNFGVRWNLKKTPEQAESPVSE